MSLNPLTYGLAAVRRTIYAGNPEATADLPSMSVSLVVAFLFSAAMFAGTYHMAGKREKGSPI